MRHDYRLTAKGLDLHPVIMAIVDWGDRHYAGEAGPPILRRHKACGCDFHAVQVCSECGEPITARDVEARPGPGAFRRAFCRSIHGPIVASVQYGVRPMTPVGSGICLRDR